MDTKYMGRLGLDEVRSKLDAMYLKRREMAGRGLFGEVYGTVAHQIDALENLERGLKLEQIRARPEITTTLTD